MLDSIAREPRVINARGAEGATPLMYAALYADAEILRAMLQAGGNPNISSDSGATALMWAVEDREKVTLLLDAGANVNATSGFGRTALSLATLHGEGVATAELLLARGAKAFAGGIERCSQQEREREHAAQAAGGGRQGQGRRGGDGAACRMFRVPGRVAAGTRRTAAWTHIRLAGERTRKTGTGARRPRARSRRQRARHQGPHGADVARHLATGDARARANHHRSRC